MKIASGCNIIWISTGYYVSGTDTIFKKVSVDISDYDGLSNLKIRFKLHSDNIIRADGWYIDDIAIKGFPIDIAPVELSEFIAE